MKKLILCLMVILCCSGMVHGWSYLSHHNITNRILEDGNITNWLAYRGLDKSAVASAAEYADIYEPQAWHDSQWADTSSLGNFTATWLTNSRPMSNDGCGWLLHNIEDTAVPVDHCPACYWYQSWCMEQQFELQGEGYGTPGWPNPPWYAYVDGGDSYTPNINGFYNEMYNLTQSFKSHNQSYWPCKYFCSCMTDWIDPSCRQAAMKNAWWTVFYFLACHP